MVAKQLGGQRAPDGSLYVTLTDGRGVIAQGSETETFITASSGNVANASAVATLAGAAGLTTYITGFQATGAGITAVGANVIVAVTGTISGTMSYIFTAPVGATVPGQPLNVTFPTPIPASAVNTSIVVTMPALGVGNTHAAVSAQGFRL